VFRLARLGKAGGELELVECGSYTCRFCKQSEPTLAAVRERFPELSIAWLQMPPATGEAVLAAKASIAARRQDRFWEMHRALFELEPPLDRARMVVIAEKLGLDRARFLADLDDPETARMVARQKRTCIAAGATATPTFFVNGDMVRGELGVDYLSRVLKDLAALED
jgi:protein-disulfide isomerase